jgi:hypothetical protein
MDVEPGQTILGELRRLGDAEDAVMNGHDLQIADLQGFRVDPVRFEMILSCHRHNPQYALNT